VPALPPAPAPAASPRGYGLVAEVVNAPPPRERTARRDDAPLPALRVRSASGAPATADRRSEPASLDPQKRVISDEPLPPRKKKSKAKEDDEDLLE
jgi:hypothetical protein